MVIKLATQKTLIEIKKSVEGCIGQRVLLRTNIGKRNAKEKKGIIQEAYPSVFIVTVNEGLQSQRSVSFSYSDILTATVEMTLCSTEEKVHIA